MSLREAYEASLFREGRERDAAQEAIVERLGELQRRLCVPPTRRGLLARLSGRHRRSPHPVRGLYVWGGVGRGKTFLMDLFFETLAIEAKKRIHFHRMMHDVHDRMTALGDVNDPLDQIAADLAIRIRVLCFDEFFVSDIGDAMILARLLESLFARGVTLVATSNTKPADLYRDGLQRQRFLPAVGLIEQHTDVVRLDGDVDYRLRLLQRAGTYLTPDDAAARQSLDHYFVEAASSQVIDNAVLEINGRDIRARRCAKGIAWFEFADICDGPRSPSDYIEIARWYPTVIVSGVPGFDRTREDQARRFVALVDEFYDRNVKLMLSAADSPEKLYRGRRLQFEYERTSSRLIEMQSTDYLALPHLA